MLVLMGKHNAAMADTNHAAIALGKTPAQTLMAMQKTRNAEIPYATMQQEFMTQQKPQQKQTAQMDWIMTAMASSAQTEPAAAIHIRRPYTNPR